METPKLKKKSRPLSNDNQIITLYEIVTINNIPLITPKPQYTHTLRRKYLTMSQYTLTQEYKRTKKVKYKLKMLLIGAYCNEELKSFIYP